MLDTHDVCLGSSASDTNPRILVTTTDEASATQIVDALKDASLFQCDGLVPFARAVDRGALPELPNIEPVGDAPTPPEPES